MPEERVSIFITAREAAGKVFRKLFGTVKKTRDEMGRFVKTGGLLPRWGAKVRAVLKRTGAAFQKLRSRISGLGLTISAISVGLITKKLFELGTAAEETRSKFSTVYRGILEEAGAFANEFGRRTGQTRQEAEELLATSGAIAQGFGFLGMKALDLTKVIANLGADLASFNNLQGGTAEGIDIINRTLTGEFERAKAVGVVIRALEVQERALANTGKKTAGALSEQERVTARLQLFTEKAGVAVGDLDRTFSEVANTSRRVFAQIRQAGETLSIVFLELIGGGFDGLDVRLERFNLSLEQNRSRILAWVKVVVQSVDFAVRAFVALFRVAFNLGKVLGGSIEIGFNLAMGAIVRGVELLGETLIKAVNNFLIWPINEVIGAMNLILPPLLKIDEIPKLDEELQGLNATAEGFFEKARAQAPAVRASIDAISSTVGDLAKQWRDVQDAATAANEAQLDASRAIGAEAGISTSQQQALDALVAGITPSVIDATGRRTGQAPPTGIEAAMLQSDALRGMVEDVFDEDTLEAVKESLLAPFVDIAQDFIAKTEPELVELHRIQLALNVARDAGKITAEDYARAMDSLNDAMQEARDGTKKTAVSFAQLAPVLANAIAQIIQGLQGGGGGFLGLLSQGLGLAAGIASVIPGGQLVGAGLAAGSILTGALASRGGQEIPVAVSRYGDRALAQMREASGPEKVTIQILDSKTGDLVDEIIYEIDRRSRIDQIIRIPRTIGG